MIAAIPAEDRPNIIVQEVRLPPAPERINIKITLAPRTCLSCGAKTTPAGDLPCGH